MTESQLLSGRARAVGRRFLPWLPAVAWAGLIFWLSAQPNLRFEPDAVLDFVVRKLGHMAVFGILALLLWGAIAVTAPLRPGWAWAAALGLLYAASDEFHQGFTAGRHPAATDVGIDGLGIAFAVAGGLTVLAWRARGSAQG